MKKRPNGLKLFDGPSLLDGSHIIAVMTGFARKSRNTETGDMLQLWILQADVHPVEARRNGSDRGMCGDCPIKSACYVEWQNAPAQVWRTNDRGAYPLFDWTEHGQWIANEKRKVRLGACGEPAALPYNLVNRICRRSAGWTGYTHQWQRFATHAGWKRLLMASVETERQADIAQALGWRTFRIMEPGTDYRANESGCPKSAEMGQVSNCENCLLCRGTSATARNVGIWGHGSAPRLNKLLPVLRG